MEELTEYAHDILTVGLPLGVHIWALFAQDLLAVLPIQIADIAHARERIHREVLGELEDRHRNVIPCRTEEYHRIGGLVVDVLATGIAISASEAHYVAARPCALTRSCHRPWKGCCDHRRRERYSRSRKQLLEFVRGCRAGTMRAEGSTFSDDVEGCARKPLVDHQVQLSSG